MKKLFFFLFTAMLAGGAARAQDGATINGVIWAKSNVGARRTFVAQPGEYGNAYKFRKAQRVCPKGWRVPTHGDFLKLYDRARVESVWTTRNGANGRLFTDKLSGESVFLPAAGFLNSRKRLIQGETDGFYWSDTRKWPLGYILHFSEKQVDTGRDAVLFGDRHSVRCVK